MMTINEIKKYCEDAFNKAGYDFNYFDIKISINGRLRTTLGRCKYTWADETLIPSEIEISRQLLETATSQAIVDVILHECAHALVTIETGERQGHNKLFKAMCARIGTNNDTCKTAVERTVEDKEIFKYFVRCAGCGQVVSKYHRAGKIIKEIDNYYSKCCNAKLIIETNW